MLGFVNQSRFLGRGCDEALFGEKKGFSVQVRISTGKAIQWRGSGHSLNCRTLGSDKLLSSSPSQKSALIWGSLAGDANHKLLSGDSLLLLCAQRSTQHTWPSFPGAYGRHGYQGWWQRPCCWRWLVEQHLRFSRRHPSRDAIFFSAKHQEVPNVRNFPEPPTPGIVSKVSPVEMGGVLRYK